MSAYEELRDNVADWMTRGDLIQYVPTFIRMFESVANRRMRTRFMETHALLTLSSGEATIPTDYLSWRRVTYRGAPQRELEFVHPSYLEAMYPDNVSGAPAFASSAFSSAFLELRAVVTGTPGVFTIEGSTIKVRPIPGSGQVEFSYYQKLPALSVAENWLYAAHPDLYLFGTLTEAAAFTQEPDKCAMWKSRRDELFLEIEQLDMQTPLGAMRVMGTVV